MDKPTAAIRNLMIRLDTSDSQLFEMLLKVVEDQQEQIDRLQRIVDAQADRIRAIGLGLQRSNGVHGA